MQRILVLVVGRGLEKRPGHFRPIVGRRNSERFLVFEMMEKRAFGHAGHITQIIDCR